MYHFPSCVRSVKKLMYLLFLKNIKRGFDHSTAYTYVATNIRGSINVSYIWHSRNLNLFILIWNVVVLSRRFVHYVYKLIAYFYVIHVLNIVSQPNQKVFCHSLFFIMNGVPYWQLNLTWKYVYYRNECGSPTLHV